MYFCPFRLIAPASDWIAGMMYNEIGKAGVERAWEGVGT